MLKAERNSWVYFGILLIFCLGLGGFMHFYGVRTNQSFDEADKAIGNARKLSETADIYRFEAVGLSMFPTLRDGGMYHADKHAIPKAGDIVAFKCLVDRCDYEGMVKFVHSIDERGCYDLQGREDEWVEEDGITYVSFDSSDFGSLCPGEIHVDGVVKNR